jgi:uncharacterized BrkB/YihY/UPF0761 family membrane protein
VAHIAHFGAYNATYGSLGAAVGMMMWMWISAIVILLGGELNAEIEHQTARDSTTGSETSPRAHCRTLFGARREGANLASQLC